MNRLNQITEKLEVLGQRTVGVERRLSVMERRQVELVAGQMTPTDTDD